MIQPSPIRNEVKSSAIDSAIFDSEVDCITAIDSAIFDSKVEYKAAIDLIIFTQK